MEKRARGEIRVHERKDGQVTYSLRFRVNGKREILTLGTDTDGWTFRKADRKLEDVLARIRAGVWEPPEPPDRDADRAQTFHVFASRWWAARKGELRPRTRENYEWRLRKHLLPFFCRLRDLGDRRRARRALPRAQGHRARAGSRGDRRRRAAAGQPRTASRSAEQREHQQDARHAHADPRQCRRARAPGFEPGSRQAAPAQGRQASATAARGRRPEGAARGRRRRWTGTSTGVTGSVGGR